MQISAICTQIVSPNSKQQSCSCQGLLISSLKSLPALPTTFSTPWPVSLVHTLTVSGLLKCLLPDSLPPVSSQHCLTPNNFLTSPPPPPHTHYCYLSFQIMKSDENKHLKISLKKKKSNSYTALHNLPSKHSLLISLCLCMHHFFHKHAFLPGHILFIIQNQVQMSPSPYRISCSVLCIPIVLNPTIYSTLYHNCLPG